VSQHLGALKTHTTDTFFFISHTTNLLLFKFRYNIFNAGFGREWDTLYKHYIMSILLEYCYNECGVKLWAGLYHVRIGLTGGRLLSRSGNSDFSADILAYVVLPLTEEQLSLPPWRNSPHLDRTSSLSRFHDYTQTHHTR